MRLIRLSEPPYRIETNTADLQDDECCIVAVDCSPEKVAKVASDLYVNAQPSIYRFFS